MSSEQPILKQGHLISMRDVSRAEIEALVGRAAAIEEGTLTPDMSGKVAALLFYEPSTRTCFSFDAAMKKMGGGTLVMQGTGGTSVKKGESFADTLKTMGQYADVLVLRSPLEGAARMAADTVDIPVINAGDGANQHPTQAMLDLYSIHKTQGTLENLTVGLVGDLRYGRTVHSLALSLVPFNPEFYFISPPHLAMPASLCRELEEKGVRFHQVSDVDPVANRLDIMYVTRIQRERFPDQEEYEKLKGSYIVTAGTLKGVQDNLRVLHPLPRVDEIATEVDETPYAYYFEQARNGVYMRQALLSDLTGGIR